jgi:hypothetical protein
MNHSFIAAQWNQIICAKCLQKEYAHKDDVTCEACNNVGPVELIGKMLLCKECALKELTPIVKPEVIEQLSIEQTLNQVNRILETNQIANADGEAVKDIIDAAIAGNIKEYKDFFNAKIPSIIDLRNLVESDESIPTDKKHYAVMSLLKRRVSYLAMVLFQTRNSQIEIGAEMKSIQFYMAETIPKLRMKLRAEFALNTPNYTPQVIKSGVPKERAKKQTPSDKIASMYAKSMKISFEEAKRIIERGLRENCTCNETPGMCKVHNS